MARSLNKLSDIAIKGKLKSGRHGDGGGLYLSVSNTGSKSWVFMWSRDGKRREMGLGPYPEVSLAAARKRAQANRAAVEEGRDPITEKAREEEPTFGECVEKFLAVMEAQWANAKHRAQWRMTLTDYCAKIQTKKVSTLTTEDVLSVLSPIWFEKPETASRLRGRIERVLDFAKVKGWRNTENPALWRGNLKLVLPPAKKLSKGHHAAMHYRDVGNFYQRLRACTGMAPRALELIILTVGRTAEVLGAVWTEFRLDEGIWIIPKERMKAKREHRVPLTRNAVELLQTLKETANSPYVFPGMKEDAALSNMAMLNLLTRMKVTDATVHGFRSSFRDWVGDETNFPRDVAEACLAHSVGNETEEAYRRMDALNKRRRLLDAWESYLTAKQAKVIKFHG